MAQLKFVPPSFCQFGERFSGLFDKDSLDQKKFGIKFSNKINDEVISSGIDFNPKGDASRPLGYLRRSFALPYKVGNLDSLLSTDNTFDFNLTNSTALKDFTITANSGYGEKEDALQGCRLGFGISHAREFLSGYFGVRTAFSAGADKNAVSHEGPVVDVVLSAGAQDVAVGGAISINSSTKEILRRDCGLDYRKNDIALSVLSTEHQKALQVAASYKLDSKTLVGASLDFNFDKSADPAPKPVFSGVAAVELDSNTSLKLRANTQAKVAADVEYTFPTPQLKLALSATFNAVDRSTETSTWGVTATFGDN